MSFTIKCDKCGNEVKLHNKDSRLGDKIQIIPDVSTAWYDGSFEILSVDFYCENPKCGNEVETK